MSGLVSAVQSGVSSHALKDPTEKYVEDQIAYMSRISEVLQEIKTLKNQGEALENLTELIVQFDELMERIDEGIEEPSGGLSKDHPALKRLELVSEEFGFKHREITAELAVYRDQCEDRAIFAEIKRAGLNPLPLTEK